MGSTRTALLLTVVACAVAGCARAAADPPPVGPLVLVTPAPGGPRVPEPQVELHPDERLSLPPVTSEMQALLDEVQTRWGDHPDLGQSEISLDRALIVLRWHGSPPAELAALAEDRPGRTFGVRLDRTPFRDSELGAEAGRLVGEHPGVVTSAWPRVEGDGVGLGIDPSAAGGDLVAALDRLGITSRFPLFPVAMPPVLPISGG